MDRLLIFALVVGALFVVLSAAIAVRRGDRLLQILDQTLMGWPPIFVVLAHVFPVLQIPVLVAMVLFMLLIMWKAFRQLLRR